MDDMEFEKFKKLPDSKLFDFVTEKDSSQRRHVAAHLLELRRNQELTRAARSSATSGLVRSSCCGGCCGYSHFGVLETISCLTIPPGRSPAARASQLTR